MWIRSRRAAVLPLARTSRVQRLRGSFRRKQSEASIDSTVISRAIIQESLSPDELGGSLPATPAVPNRVRARTHR